MTGIVIISGSPRNDSKSLKFAQELFNKKIKDDPNREATLVSISDLKIEGCCGCNGCKSTFECVKDDDMSEIYDFVEGAEEICVVTPIYMAGVPAKLKAVLDRFQPMFWQKRRKETLRPACLYLFGEGKDPYGVEGAILTLKSALHVAGFEVKEVVKQIN